MPSRHVRPYCLGLILLFLLQNQSRVPVNQRVDCWTSLILSALKALCFFQKSHDLKAVRDQACVRLEMFVHTRGNFLFGNVCFQAAQSSTGPGVFSLLSYSDLCLLPVCMTHQLPLPYVTKVWHHLGQVCVLSRTLWFFCPQHAAECSGGVIRIYVCGSDCLGNSDSLHLCFHQHWLVLFLCVTTGQPTHEIIWIRAVCAVLRVT